MFAGSRSTAKKRQRAPKRTKERPISKPAKKVVTAAAASIRPSRPPSPAVTPDKPLEPLAIDIEDRNADLWLDAIFDAPLLDLSVDEAVELTTGVV